MLHVLLKVTDVIARRQKWYCWHIEGIRSHLQGPQSMPPSRSKSPKKWMPDKSRCPLNAHPIFTLIIRVHREFLHHLVHLSGHSLMKLFCDFNLTTDTCVCGRPHACNSLLPLKMQLGHILTFQFMHKRQQRWLKREKERKRGEETPLPCYKYQAVLHESLKFQSFYIFLEITLWFEQRCKLMQLNRKIFHFLPLLRKGGKSTVKQSGLIC